MLESLGLRNVGPAPEMALSLASRFNVITGDNGLGKSFLLDVAWWALTRTWAGRVALPAQGKKGRIEYVVRGKTGRARPVESLFRRDEQSWPVDAKRPPMPGIVVYVRVDGGYSVWDPARNYWRTEEARPNAYQFNAQEIWDGLTVNDQRACDGLERDWVKWQEGGKPEFRQLEQVLKALSPAGEPIEAGSPRRVFLGEGFDRPTLRVGEHEVPVAVASAGVRRILALAYLLVWAWKEHQVAAELLDREPESRFVLLFDEPETHLHPRWQRTVLPSLLEALKGLHRGPPLELQLLVATHAPLVLASLEPLFDEKRDRLFHLRKDKGGVAVESLAWAKQGDVASWLVSEVFGLSQARSLQAEQAIERAEQYMRGEHGSSGARPSKEQLHAELRRLLPAHDVFWPRWLVHRKEGK